MGKLRCAATDQATEEGRTRLALLQAGFLRALSGQADAPAGADAARLRVLADSLARKRLRSVARAWPSLARTLGIRFVDRFTTYAAQNPSPRAGGPLADGRAFARFLGRVGDLPDAVRLEAVGVDLRFVSWKSGLVLRRGPAIKIAWLKQKRSLVLGVRVPGFGQTYLALPLRFRRKPAPAQVFCRQGR